MRKVLSFLYLEKLIRLSINSNTENNSFVLILCALVMRIPFCGINITISCPVFNGIKYTFDFADKRTSEKGDAKNTGWLARGGRTAG